MSEWIIDEIGNHIKTYAGGTPNRAVDTYFNGDIPWISSGEVNQSYIEKTNEHISLSGLESSSAKWIPKGAVLLAMYGATAGQVAKLKIKATANQAVLALIPDEAYIDKDYLFHVLDFEKERILYLAQGSGQPNLSKSLIDNYKIWYPKNIDHQKKSSSILDTCDTVIEQTQAAIEKYKAIKQGMLHDLFTRGLTASGQLRPTPQQAPELYKQSEFGLIPKEWEVKRLEEISTIHSGIDYKKNPHGEDVPIYGTGGIMGYTSRSLNEGPAVLTGRKGSINRPFYVEGKFWNVDTIFCLKTIGENNTKWLYYNILRINMNRYNEATGVPSITSKTLNKLSFCHYSKNEQDKIIERINPIDTKLQSEEALLLKYQSIKKGLMSDLLSGKRP